MSRTKVVHLLNGIRASDLSLMVACHANGSYHTSIYKDVTCKKCIRVIRGFQGR